MISLTAWIWYHQQIVIMAAQQSGGMTIGTKIAIGSFFVAILSLCLSAFNMYRTLDKIEISWHTSVVKPGHTDLAVSVQKSLSAPTLKEIRGTFVNNNEKENTSVVARTLKNALIFQVSIVNYGSNDMGYFQLQVKDNNGKIFPILTEEQLNRDGMSYLLEKVDEHNLVPITIPSSSHGTIPAHSFSMWNVVITCSDPKATWLKAEIALTKKRWFKPLSKAYEGHSMIYPVPETLILMKSGKYGNDANNK